MVQGLQQAGMLTVCQAAAVVPELAVLLKGIRLLHFTLVSTSNISLTA
jgi:hypothetical protein